MIGLNPRVKECWQVLSLVPSFKTNVFLPTMYSCSDFKIIDFLNVIFDGKCDDFNTCCFSSVSDVKLVLVMMESLCT